MEYQFTLIYQVAEDEDPGLLVERLGKAGLDDALVGTARPGRLALAFSREAATASLAVRSALEDVDAALPEARLLQVLPVIE
ncbi:hypothetical protein [Stenotrophomonas oahuensis]|uniref:Uncharacterized protein n=1 Tax=Stenotrophomonas oahuensis TaxID=3003271 RepID=A0ABY9YMB9_9GAMM|nr:hypothetical protein [Stenotrophomonas sp. A5586]WNH51780.1 hypothetical protein PDM29_15725 [Stenotrophomonas sp. A5586]